MPDDSWTLIYGNVHDPMINDIVGRVESELRRGVRALHIGLATVSAHTNAALLGYNYLRGCGATIHTHLLGVTDNVGGLLLLAGHTRRVFPHSIFTFVDVWQPVHENADESTVREKANTIAASRRAMANVLATNSRLSVSEAERMIRDQLGIDAPEMKACGIATEIDDRPFPGGELQPWWIVHA